MKVVVYTCIIGNYDNLFSPLKKTPGVDFVVLADRRYPLTFGWRARPAPHLPDSAPQKPALINRYAKMHPHLIFEDYDIAVYVDANFLIKSDQTPQIKAFAASFKDIGQFHHFKGYGISDEIDAAIEIGRVKPEDVAIARAQQERYNDLGYGDLPVTENNILFYNLRSAKLIDALGEWWEELNRFAPRDQFSSPFIFRQAALDIHYWDLSQRAENPYFHMKRHKPENGFTATETIRTLEPYKWYYRLLWMPIKALKRALGRPV